ncbi:MAG: hypothetical protein ACM3MK_02020 [Chitinophagales bacterium]
MDILLEIKQAFNFLIDKYNFELQMKTRNAYAVLKYRRKDIGIDLEVEYVDFCVSVMIVRITNGKEPKVYIRDDNGKKYREYLEIILMEAGLISQAGLKTYHKINQKYRKKGISIVEKTELESIMIKQQADLLAKYIDYIIEKKEGLF